ncbi:hypothetical protein M422DRAFT_247845 [Sphaerobolus stellatus SS14]|nr:hypothetical protein M422DRAFT_247845 [Sphaerobolus stellatus SS14]
MKDGGYWKLMLGRRIKLSPDDSDGSEWIGDFLEDAFVTRGVSLYETVEERAGIWVTRPTEWDTEMAENDEEKTIDPINYEDNYDIYIDTDSADEDLMYVAEDESESEEEEPVPEAIASDPTVKYYYQPPLFDSDSNSDSDMAGSDWDSSEALSGNEADLGRT